MIPKIIHQTFKTKLLPQELQEIVTGLREQNPNCEYRFYDDLDCISYIEKNYDKKTLTTYLKINPKLGMARADLFRYLLMYKEGGIYLDIKSTTVGELHKMLLPTDTFVGCHWLSRENASLLIYALGEFENWNIICSPNHPILKAVIEEVKYNINNYIDMSYRTYDNVVLMTTGPIAYSQAILKVKNKYSEGFREIRKHTDIGLIYNAYKESHHVIYPGFVNTPLVIN